MKSTSVLLVLVFAAVSAGLFGKELKVVVPQLSPQATTAYSKLAVAVIEATGNTASVQVMPFARCVYLMESGQADVESTIVQIPDPSKWAALKYDYSTAVAVKVVFVLYTNKKKPINAAELKKGGLKGLRLETDTAHVNHFNFATTGSTSIDGSLKKLDAGDIDGFLFSQGSTDVALKRLGLKNITRQYFDTFNGVFVLAKAGHGGEIDKLLSDGLAKIKQNGKYQEIMGSYLAGASSFIDWQP